MSSCKSCGVEIPDGQRICSMCYGDPYYGHDGYYLAWLEYQEEQYIEQQRQIEEEKQFDE